MQDVYLEREPCIFKYKFVNMQEPRVKRLTRFTARQSRQLSRIEDELQEDLSRETIKPKSRLNRLRKTGEKYLHSKGILLLVVLLNGLDCVLVLSELVLDVAFIKSMIETAENTMETFNYILKETYPDQFRDVPVFDTHIFYNRVLRADLTWDNSSALRYCSYNNDSSRTKRAASPHIMKRVVLSKTFEPSDDPEFLHNDPEFFHDNLDTTEEIISHAFHKASIIILGILVCYIIVKVFCVGTALLKHKLELFDSFVIVASFIADIYFIDGLTNYPLESFVLILALMIPWRVIRVLNSLIISVKDNFTLQMKLMYKKTKMQSEKLSNVKFDNEQKQRTIDCLIRLCKTAGITKEQIYETLGPECRYKADKDKSKVLPFGSCFGLSTSPSFEYGHRTSQEYPS